MNGEAHSSDGKTRLRCGNPEFTSGDLNSRTVPGYHSLSSSQKSIIRWPTRLCFRRTFRSSFPAPIRTLFLPMLKVKLLERYNALVHAEQQALPHRQAYALGVWPSGGILLLPTVLGKGKWQQGQQDTRLVEGVRLKSSAAWAPAVISRWLQDGESGGWLISPTTLPLLRRCASLCLSCMSVLLAVRGPCILRPESRSVLTSLEVTTSCGNDVSAVCVAAETVSALRCSTPLALLRARAESTPGCLPDS